MTDVPDGSDLSDLCACGEVASARVDITLAGDATKTRGLCGECALSLGVMLDTIETQLLPPLKAIDHAASVVEPWRQLKARQRDRTALAEARALLDMARYTSDDSGLVRQIDDYLKRTEPTDE